MTLPPGEKPPKPIAAATIAATIVWFGVRSDADRRRRRAAANTAAVASPAAAAIASPTPPPPSPPPPWRPGGVRAMPACPSTSLATTARPAAALSAAASASTLDARLCTTTAITPPPLPPVSSSAAQIADELISSTNSTQQNTSQAVFSIRPIATRKTIATDQHTPRRASVDVRLSSSRTKHKVCDRPSRMCTMMMPWTARSSTCDGDEHEDKKKAEDEEANDVVKKMLAENEELLDRFEAVHGLSLSESSGRGWVRVVVARVWSLGAARSLWGRRRRVCLVRCRVCGRTEGGTGSAEWPWRPGGV